MPTQITWQPDDEAARPIDSIEKARLDMAQRQKDAWMKKKNQKVKYLEGSDGTVSRHQEPEPDPNAPIWTMWSRKIATRYELMQEPKRRDDIETWRKFSMENFGAEWEYGPVQLATAPRPMTYERVPAKPSAVSLAIKVHVLPSETGPTDHPITVGPSVIRGIFVDGKPQSRTFATEAELARALFDADPALLAEAVQKGELLVGLTPDADGWCRTSEPLRGRLRAILDVMWAKTKPAERRHAELLARVIFTTEAP